MNKNIKIQNDSLNLMPFDLIKEFRAFVIEKKRDYIKIAAVNPNNPILQQYIRKTFSENIEWIKTTEDELASILKNYKHDFRAEISQLTSEARETNNNISQVVNRIIKYAISERASDIHIEPIRNGINIRFRVDGILHMVLQLPRNVHQAIIANLKILANLKIDEYRRPQDGRIELEDLPNISFRISIMPTLFGQKAALRILHDSEEIISMQDLGFSGKEEGIIIDNIKKPFGMIIASGPTGSGKTTTLYALLQLLKKEGFNISTLEDPIEYVLDEVNQIQINPRVDLTFPSGLRSLLRQDPDVIMVGEIRDSETAIMAANAALTGHLVFTTLHTNDAASAFIRLLEMKVEDFVISSTVNLVVAQRLVRKICDNCAIEEKLDPVILKKINERKDVVRALEEKEKGLSNKIKNRTFRIGKGCEKCFQTGYLGRLGIFELLTPNKEIHDLVLNHGSAEDIELAAKKSGFNDMITDGLEKVFEGITTFSEILRETKTV